MSLLYFTGFDFNQNPEHYFLYAAPYDINVFSAHFTGRYGGKCLGARESFGSRFGRVFINPAEQTLIVGVAGRFESFPSFGPVFQLNNININPNIELCIGANKVIYIRLRGTQTIDTGIFLDWNTWYYLELKGKIHNTQGEVEVRVNGVTVFSQTGLNTAYSSSILSSSYVTLIRDVGGWSFFDDFYICNTTGTKNNTFLGDIKVVTLFPTRDGTYNEFSVVGASNRYEAVDETTPNYDTDYVTQSGINLRQTFGFTAPSINGSIAGLRANVFARKDDAGSRFMKLLGKYNTTEVLHSTVSLLDNYKHYYSPIHEVNFATGNDWGVSELGTLEYGVKIVES